MNRKLTFWGIVILFLGVFIYNVSDILFPFVTGLLIAYLFDPIADKLDKRGVGRGIAAGFIVVTFFTILAVASVLLGPILMDQISYLVDSLPDYIEDIKNEFIPRLEHILYEINPDIVENAKEQSENSTGEITKILGDFFAGVLSSSLWIFNIISLIALTPFIAFYILRDWDKFIQKIDSLLPQDYAPKIRQQAKKIDDTIAGFLRGQLNVCLILGTFYSIALTLAGLKFGFAIGFFSGLLCFIPFIGTMLGIVIGVGVAIAQFDGEVDRIIIIAIIYGIGQIAEGNFLTPRIVGDKIGVHPAWLIFGMLAGGTLLGIVGVLIAVPLTAIIGVLVKFAVLEYEGSDFYKKSVQAAGKKPARKKKK